ncbi:hypothetical protein B0I35DRAFT_40764 [Stachybotrys elegans]|uniref:RING-type E3 ubiquitin transferase n=1 Tax=Stachybotrys elegans TaxID=80388 RepID=A0A8K0WXH7_9HYPO|nr:hypothetical protein B0I35DRAFT_40764 [Stachybotrys elegans]
MASAGGGSGFGQVEARGNTDDGYASSSSSTSDDFSGSSSNALGTHVCPWRSLQFHVRECSRYFDCPTHVVERRLSVDETQDETQNVAEVGGEAGDDHNSASSLTHENEDPILPTTESAETQPLDTSRVASEVAPEEHLVTPTEPAVYPIRTSSATGYDRAPPSEQADSNERSQSTSSESDDLYQHSDEEEPPRALPQPQPRNSTPAALDWNRRHSMPYPQATRMEAADSNLVSPQQEHETEAMPEFFLPRWQPDAEVTYCPICQSQFSIFVRKHHCRKCGRVVCNSCSPHRIIIPHQYIVRPPGSEIPLPQSLLIDGLGGGYFDVNGLSGGERVRLCNPCVPDPNTAPPHSPSPAPSPRASHYRSRSSLANAYGSPPHTNRYGIVLSSRDPYHHYSSRSRSVTMGHSARATAGGPSSSSSSRFGGVESYRSPLHRLQTGGPSSSHYTPRYSSISAEASSSRHRALPPAPQIAEEDECPICHRELPSRSLPDFETLRETHITSCIQSHSAYGSPRSAGGGTAPPMAPRRTGMYAYAATEKDCVDDAECTICLEEFTVGVRMARLECLCRFHYSCISAWFVNHPGRCPVHQHDGFGY